MNDHQHWTDYPTDEIDQLIDLVSRIEQPITYTIPGDTITDDEGRPLYTLPPVTKCDLLAAVHLAPTQWEAMTHRLIERMKENTDA